MNLLLRLKVLLIVLAIPVFAYAVDMKEGNWETTIEFKMDIPGMPAEMMQPMEFTHTDCLTKKDMVPDTSQKDQTCKMKDQKIIGNKVSWKVKCEDAQAKTEGQGEITYSGSSYKGTMKARMIPKEKGAQPMTVDYKLAGRRLGDCPK